MAEWSHQERTLYTKLVYYGPGFGGKTTNLRALHRITDPRNRHKLLSVKTADDCTLFFDLLNFELGEILGYQVTVKVYTVPGPVRYETPRKVVVSDADAVVFVADSSPDRCEQNVWSLQNLRMNLHERRSETCRVPILFQFNKQDLPDRARPKEIAGRLGIRSDQGLVSVATAGQGVLETFVAACRAMLVRLVDLADPATRRRIDPRDLTRHVDRAFAPHLARLAGQTGRLNLEGSDSETGIVGKKKDLLEEAVRTGTALGEMLTEEVAKVRRLERERAKIGDETLKARFLQDVTERMRVALARILETAGVLREGKSNAASRRELIDGNIAAARRLERELDDLARLGRLGSGGEPPAPCDHSPERLVREALRLSGREDVSYAIEGLPDSLRLDLGSLSRAVANLIENAVKFSPERDSVRLELGRTGDDLVLSVLDRGPGVHPQDRERIFGLFERGADPPDVGQNGAGIGLHEARSLVRRQGGVLQYHPRKGGGSEFRLILPIEATTAERRLLEAHGA